MPKRSRLQTQMDTGGADTVTEATYVALRRAILSLDLSPGAVLPISMLRRRFPFGPTPLREALARLSGEGLATLSAQRGFRVAPMTTEDLAAIRTQCAQIEPMAIRAAVAANAPAWRAGLVAAYAAFEPFDAMVGDTRNVDEVWERLHQRFHLALMAGCGSPTLLARIGALYDMMNRYRRLAMPCLGYAAFYRMDHEELYHTALSGDADRAATLLQGHLHTASGQIASMFEAVPRLSH